MSCACVNARSSHGKIHCVCASAAKQAHRGALLRSRVSRMLLPGWPPTTAEDAVMQPIIHACATKRRPRFFSRPHVIVIHMCPARKHHAWMHTEDHFHTVLRARAPIATSKHPPNVKIPLHGAYSYIYHVARRGCSLDRVRGGCYRRQRGRLVRHVRRLVRHVRRHG